MLTTIDLPVVSHVTRASVREPFLGMMLTLDALYPSVASEMEVRFAERSPIDQSRSAARPRLLDGLVGSSTAGRAALVPDWPLIQQEITVRLPTGQHGPQLGS
jgi:hypothetical protein